MSDMNLLSRHKNTVVLATVLLAQLLALGVQVKRQTAEGPVRLIRFAAVNAIAPFERVFIYAGESVRGVWENYLDLRSVRRENLRLRAQAGQMRLERAREQEEARQARRIQALLGFKEQWIDTTVAAQVIGTSGMETSRLLYLDKGTKDGIRADMPVITPDGVVGKVLTVYGETSQVLMINDLTSGVGAILVNSRLQGIVKGTPTGEVQLNYIMGDESVRPGETLVTSGGDRVFPKGLPIGTVAKVSPGRDLFLQIQLKPAVDLNRLEEVLVITEQKPRAPDADGLGAIRASDILAEHLPGVPATAPGEAPHSASQGVPAASPKPSQSADGSKLKSADGSKLKVAETPKPKSADGSKLKVAEAPKPKTADGSKLKTAETPKPKTAETPKPKTAETPKPKTADGSKLKTADGSKLKTAEAPKPKTAASPKPKVAAGEGTEPQ